MSQGMFAYTLPPGPNLARGDAGRASLLKDEKRSSGTTIQPKTFGFRILINYCYTMQFFRHTGCVSCTFPFWWVIESNPR